MKKILIIGIALTLFLLLLPARNMISSDMQRVYVVELFTAA
jgi:hypothetical protein